MTHPGATDAHLLIWAFEDWLKKYFYTLLQILETLSHDTLPFVRTQTLTIVYQMLKDKPEQEQNLLRLLVNKLVRPAFRHSQNLCRGVHLTDLSLVAPHSVIHRETLTRLSRPEHRTTFCSCFSRTLQ